MIVLIERKKDVVGQTEIIRIFLFTGKEAETCHQPAACNTLFWSPKGKDHQITFLLK